MGITTIIPLVVHPGILLARTNVHMLISITVIYSVRTDFVDVRI